MVVDSGLISSGIDFIKLLFVSLRTPLSVVNLIRKKLFIVPIYFKYINNWVRKRKGDR